jgi:hypothetical protein
MWIGKGCAYIIKFLLTWLKGFDMALINCPECDHQVSDQAFKCPSCGSQLRKAKRSFMGKLIKWTFILFNLLMLWWMIGGIGAGSEAISSANSDAQQAGAAIGTGIGMIMIGGIWLVGDVVLGLLVLFTRPKAN